MLEGLSKHRSDYHTCAVALISKTLEKKDFELLEEYIADETWGIRGLSEALAKRGVDIGLVSRAEGGGGHPATH